MSIEFDSDRDDVVSDLEDLKRNIEGVAAEPNRSERQEQVDEISQGLDDVIDRLEETESNS